MNKHNLLLFSPMFSVFGCQLATADLLLLQHVYVLRLLRLSTFHFDNHEKALAPPTGFADLVLPNPGMASFFSLWTSSKLVLPLASLAGKNLDCEALAVTGLGLLAFPATFADTVLETGFVGRKTLIPSLRR
jgi:hypothetical protein